MAEENGVAVAEPEPTLAAAVEGHPVRSKVKPKKKKKVSLPPKKSAAKSKSKAKVPSAAKKPPKEKKPNLLDAAAKVIRGLKTPISAPDILERIEKQKLWKSPKGKTPTATLATAIAREIGVPKPRFKRAGKGLYLPA